jgi:hypothetical protein
MYFLFGASAMHSASLSLARARSGGSGRINNISRKWNFSCPLISYSYS